MYASEYAVSKMKEKGRYTSSFAYVTGFEYTGVVLFLSCVNAVTVFELIHIWLTSGRLMYFPSIAKFAIGGSGLRVAHYLYTGLTSQMHSAFTLL